MSSNSNPLFSPDAVFVDETVSSEPLVQQILARLDGVPHSVVEGHEGLPAKLEDAAGSIARQKKHLFLAGKRGAWLKRFRANECGDTVEQYYLTHIHGCPMDCEYCYLQGYFETHVPTVYVELDELFDAVREAIAQNPEKAKRFHVGELCDALALDHLVTLSPPLIEIFGTARNATVEFRTKTTNVESLLATEPNENVVVSWTFTPANVAQAYERGAASVQARIDAARACQSAGYRVGVRFDPIFRSDTYDEDYAELISALAAALSPDRIDSVVLGAFRYTAEMERAVRQRDPGTRLFLDEFVRCGDGKFRYFRPIRLKMYAAIAQRLRSVWPAVPIELAMEPPDLLQTFMRRYAVA